MHLQRCNNYQKLRSLPSSFESNLRCLSHHLSIIRIALLALEMHHKGSTFSTFSSGLGTRLLICCFATCVQYPFKIFSLASLNSLESMFVRWMNMSSIPMHGGLHISDNVNGNNNGNCRTTNSNKTNTKRKEKEEQYYQYYIILLGKLAFSGARISARAPFQYLELCLLAHLAVV